MQFLSQAEIIKTNFLKELQDSSEGKITSLRFIKHELPTQHLIKDGHLFQVFVIGGTVFRKALLKKEAGKLIIIDEYSEKHPILSSKENFLNYLARHLYVDTDIIAINFAFPLKPFLREGRIDGDLLSANKAGNTLIGLIDQPVGLTIEQFFLERLQRKTLTAVVNDSICLLLSGIADFPKNSLAGAIIGTGTNLTFFHNETAINTQSGGFNKFSLSEAGKEVDKNSLKPSASLFEKEIAGGYLYKQFNYLIEKNKIDHLPINSTKELSSVLSGSQSVETKSIAHSLFEKSAAYFAAQLAGLTAFKRTDMTFIIEGSLFWEESTYQRLFGEYLRVLSPGLNIKFKKIENSQIIGAARLIT